MTTDKKFHLDVNASTGEKITREFTAEEYALAEVAAQEAAAFIAAEEALAALKASAKAKLIAGTKLTAEEAELLVI